MMRFYIIAEAVPKRNKPSNQVTRVMNTTNLNNVDLSRSAIAEEGKGKKENLWFTS